MENIKDIYQSRPWMKLYPSWYPVALDVPDISALDMFETSVKSHPRSPFIHYFDDTLSYQEINQFAESLASGLKELGVVKGDRVIVQLQNIPQFLIAVYGIWKVGGIVVPLNPMYKERELEFYIGDARAKVAITMEACYSEIVKLLTKTPLQSIITTSELDFFTKRDYIPDVLRSSVKQHCEGSIDFVGMLKKYKGVKARGGQKPAPEDIAYLTYTSGTTGPPKGAMNLHRNLVFSAHCVKALYQLDSSDKTLAMSPFIHVIGSVNTLATSSLLGMPIIAFYRFEPGEVLRLASKWKATISPGTPTAYLSLITHPDFDYSKISSLRKTCIGGAPISPAFFDRFKKATGQILLNGYGLTEATSLAILTPLGCVDPLDPVTGALSIGFPIPNTQVRIVDENAKDLPPGQEGEIIVKGPTVIPGYWNKPDETAHTIRDGWLFTGDIGKMDENGWFYLVDRKKDLIIASGYKIWPREVEDVLCSHNAVKEACVVGVPDAYRGETVKAFVVLNRSCETNSDELIQYCKKRMAAYKYPRAIDIVSELPKTISGKILRRMLKEQEIKRRNNVGEPSK